MKSNLYEDKKLQPIIVILSPKVLNKIETIEQYNRDNTSALSQWYEYIDGLESYISNPVIAWDNTGRYQHNSKKETHLKEAGYDVIYTIKIDKTTNTNYVYILNIKFNLQEFDLKDPDSIPECYPSAIKPKSISNETLYRLMSEQYERYLYSLF